MTRERLLPTPSGTSNSLIVPVRFRATRRERFRVTNNLSGSQAATSQLRARRFGLTRLRLDYG